ncbi:amidohydrolase family protein [Herbiconiux sp. A18JL235]|uniref:Amidohydrolase family protein n=1 Tax=Herbiconiux sp. A18JL235 TaxID=3152363 RepID=A0AB39BI41_9MICO
MTPTSPSASPPAHSSLPFEGYVIAGATVVDGSGRPSHCADVRVRAGRIAAVGRVDRSESDHVLDASGLVLSPGFIDTHAHDDTAALHQHGLRPKRQQGVTTVVTGNCGIGIAPGSPELDARLSADLKAVLGFPAPPRLPSFSSFVDALDAAPLQCNVRPLVAHAALRYLAALPDQREPADAGGRQRLAALLDDALDQGAAGMSTGLVYEPCSAADPEELVTLAARLAARGAVFAVHVRDEGARLLPSLREVIDVARRSACRLHISHLKATGRGSVDRMERALDLIDTERAAGVDITFDVYPYAAGSTALLPALRADENRGEPRSTVQLTSVPGEPELSGRWLSDVAEERGLTLEQTAAMILDRSPSTSAIIHMMHPESVKLALAHEACFIGSDGLPSPDGLTHPRQYGTFPRVLERYCGTDGLTLERVISRMTALPSERFSVPGRGRIEPGLAADLVLFDPLLLGETGTYELPAQRPRGMSAVLVAGRADDDGTFGQGQVL